MPAVGPLAARVVPDVSGLDKEFDYLVPESLRDQVRVGTLVRVPLHGRRVGGWVVALGESDVDPEKLKPIAKVTGHGPSADLIELARWAAHRWAGPLRAVLTTASPVGAVKALPGERRRRVAPPDELDVGIEHFLDLGGGVVRRAPAASVLSILTTAARRGPLLVVTPSIARAAVAAARLRRLGLSVAVVPEEWATAAAGVDVVVGARRAAWAPVPGLAAVVVLDEHEESLQEERSPTWHARDVARERARRAGVPFLAVSPVPSLSALEVAGPRILTPSRIEERQGWPIVAVIDRNEDDPWVTSLVGSELIRHLRDPARRVVCVLNTTGRARRLACKACRELALCEACSTPVAERVVGVLHCDRCGTERPKICQACGAARLVMLRPGVSRLREELEAAAGRPVAEVTAALDDSSLVGVDVFVGTEAVLHRVRRIDTVAFLDLDAELLAPRYRAGEQALALLALAARLVGGRDGTGRLLVQTFLPRDDVVEAVHLADPERAVTAMREQRALLGFPPFGALAAFSGPGADDFALALRGAPEVKVMGPGENGRYLVRSPDPVTLADALGATARPAGSRLRVEVDPPRV
jgi:primosomal protein N' (replication factor Y)